MKTPRQRVHANRITNHHVNWPKLQWNSSPVHKEARNTPELIMGGMVRHHHDRLHMVMQGLALPPKPVAETIIGIAQAHGRIHDDIYRLQGIAGALEREAQQEPRLEYADRLLEVATHYMGQVAIINMGGLR